MDKKWLNKFKKSKILSGTLMVNPDNMLQTFVDLPPMNKDCQGIYFLMYGNFVVYVGMSSVSISDRIYGGGLSEGHIFCKAFNGIKYIDTGCMTKREIEDIEKTFIYYFNPPYNRMGKHEDPINKKYIKESETSRNEWDVFQRKCSEHTAIRIAKIF